MTEFASRWWGVGLVALALLHVPGARGAEEPEREGQEKKIERRVVVLPGERGGPPQVLRGFTGAFLGVEVTGLTPELRAHFGVPEEAGVLIARVLPESPAAAAGLQVGDIVTAVGEARVGSPWDLTAEIRSRRGGEGVVLEVWRGGRRREVTATLEEREREEIDLAPLVHLRRREGAPILVPPSGEELEIVVSPEAVERLGESLESIDWPRLRERLGPRREVLEKRLEELERRLQELEAELERLRERP